MNTGYLLVVMFSMAGVTFLARCLPFYFIEAFRDSRAIKYLATMLPAPIMLILVIFSVKDTAFVVYPYGVPELLAIAVTAWLHLYKRIAILSIVGGVLVYGLLLSVMA
jgi:branched-subunit amino acid transport protein AzlD